MSRNDVHACTGWPASSPTSRSFKKLSGLFCHGLGLGDPELERLRPVPLGPVGEGDDQVYGSTHAANKINRQETSNDDAGFASISNRIASWKRWWRWIGRAAHRATARLSWGREAVAGLPVHRRPPELELRPRGQRHLGVGVGLGQ
jgi:hypothetical protein